MRQNGIKLISSAFFSILFLFLASIRCDAQSAEQEIALRPGWNAVYLEVEPEPGDCNSVFGGIPVESVWFWSDHAASTTAQYLDIPPNPDELRPQSPWLVYFPPDRTEHVLTSLHHIHGGRSYMVKVEAEVTWVVRGQPCLPRIQWVPDAYNLTGFHVGVGDEPHAVGPTFAAFFSGSTAHVDVEGNFYEPVYCLRNGRWEVVMPEESLERGRAYWVYSSSKDDTFTGPLGVRCEFGQSIWFEGNMITHTLVLSNRADRDMTVTLDILDDLPLQRMADVNNWVDADEFELSIGPGSASEPNEVQVLLGIDRTRMTGDDSDILVVSSNEGIRIAVPVWAGARTAAGLWVGIVDVNEVAQRSGEMKGVLQPFQFRLMLHVDANGVTHLLNEVVEVGSSPQWEIDPNTGAQTMLSAEEGALYTSSLPGELTSTRHARRISSVVFSFGEPIWMSGSFGNPGGELTCSIDLDETDYLHPYIHSYHPDHRYNVNDPNEFKITRAIKLMFREMPPQAGLGWGDSWIDGTYEDTITGLIRYSVKVGGTFRLRHISLIDNLK